MNLRSTFILALIFAALAGYVLYVELPRAKEKSSDDVLIDVDVEAVSRVELEHPGRKVVLERRGDDVWHMIEPVDAPADARSIENLITAVADAKVTRTLEEAGDPAAFGLDVPSATIRLQSGEHEPRVLEIGKNAPVGGSVYVRRGGEKEIRLSDAGLARRIDQQPEDLRDRTILSFDKDAVTGLSIAGTGRETVSLAKEEGEWRITAPGEWKADRSAVDGLLSTLQSMRAVEFLSEDGAEPARFGLDTPQRVLTLTFAAATDDADKAAREPLELRIGSEREGKLNVQTNRRSTVYSVAAWVADSVAKDAAYFRDKKIVSFDAGDAARIEIASPAEPNLALIRTDGGWTVAGDPNAKVLQAAVNDLLDAASDLEGFEVAAEGPFDPGELAALGLEPARRTIRVLGRGGEQLASLRIGPHAVDGAQTEYAAVTEGATAAFRIREDIYQRLDANADKLVERAEPSERPAPPIPDGEPGDGVDHDALDDAAAAGE